ncbi:MAG: radical SAM/SPASM domain-containing protein [Bacteroidales bacterium]|nr:radical SAM/SPASM domain-containing protein [Bacteroidales bacterium]
MFPYYFQLFTSLNLRRVLNFVLVETSYFLSRLIRIPIIAGNPWAASIEPTTSCNLRCPECPTGMLSLSRPNGNMHVDVFGTILDKLSPDLMYLTLYFQGEPLLNPGFTKMVQMTRKRRIFVATSTNGHYLNDRNVDEIIKSGLNHLVISMDGTDQKTYEKYRVRGDLQTVSDGIERLVAAKKAVKSSTPFIELQFIVMRHNEHQIQQMREFAKQSGVDTLSFKTAQVYNFDAESAIIPTLKSKSRYRKTSDGNWVMVNKIRNRCHRIWSSLVITWDGKVVPCCYDKNADHQTGNLLDEPLSEIWKNQKYTAFRRQVLKNRSANEICRNCGE